MVSPAISTLIKMMETLSEDAQNQVVEHLREYMAEIEDEIAWEASFEKTQIKLIAAAQRAKKEISEGRSSPMDYEQL